MTNRDDFSKSTVDVLGKRAGYMCSNPACRKHTSGPNSNDSKSTLIGIGAHITAAAPGGPRYDISLSVEERRHINNGIWLCGNCASLIDKDEVAYPTELLRFWKSQIEWEMHQALASQGSSNKVRQERPILEASLITRSSQRGPVDYGNTWKIEWHLLLSIQNNSSFPAYNVKVIVNDNVELQIANYLSTANNLAPLASLNLEANSKVIIKGDYMDADALMQGHLPKHLNGPIMKIIYKDEARNEHITLVSIDNNEIVNQISK